MNHTKQKLQGVIMDTNLEKVAHLMVNRGLPGQEVAAGYLREIGRVKMLEDTVKYLIEDYCGVDLAPEAEMPKDIQDAIDCLPEDKKPS